MSGSIVALPATTNGGLLFGLPTQRLKVGLGWGPHLIFSHCQPWLLSSARAFSLVAKSPTCRNGETAGVLRGSSL